MTTPVEVALATWPQAVVIEVTLANWDPDAPVMAPSLDFSIAANSQYLPLIFEDI